MLRRRRKMPLQKIWGRLTGRPAADMNNGNQRSKNWPHNCRWRFAIIHQYGFRTYDEVPLPGPHRLSKSAQLFFLIMKSFHGILGSHEILIRVRSNETKKRQLIKSNELKKGILWGLISDKPERGAFCISLPAKNIFLITVLWNPSFSHF